MKNFLLLLSLILCTIISAQSTEIPFYNNGTYDSAIPAPQDVLGFEIGKRPTRYHETVQYIKTLSEKSPLVNLYELGETHQGRKLYYLTVTSEKNNSNIEKIKGNLAKLADIRKLASVSEADDIIKNSPAVAMMMYSIHGNEASGTDASLQLAYQLAAGTDAATKKLLDELVIIIYPMENPDGRARFNGQVETWNGEVNINDSQSLPHSGVWPSGRTNHYHFDLNRDWFILSQPESRSRVKTVLEWNPQLVVDAHEMGSFSSFLFNPPREPINPNMDKRIINAWDLYAAGQAEAFDEYSWSYYTREWLEEWYPGYGSSWPSYGGAVSILYEQARTSGLSVKRPDGQELTFRESVHHQFISSLANLKTLANNREEMLKDYYEINRDALNKSRADGVKSFIIDPADYPARVKKLVEVLTYQGIEVYKTENELTVKGRSYWDKNSGSHKLSGGAYVIPVQQPRQDLVNAIFEFDTRMNNYFLKTERENLEKGKGTRLYEVTAWSIPLAYGVNAYASSEMPSVGKYPVKEEEPSKGSLLNSGAKYGYVIEYKDDSAIDALLMLFEKGYKIQSAEKPFTVGGKNYGRGTLLLRNIENPELAESDLAEIADKSGADIIGVNTALAEKGTDLGGGNFSLLEKPKTAMLIGGSISLYNYGAMRYLFDYELGMKVSSLNALYLNFYDLRKYNVIVIPSVWGGVSMFKQILGKGGEKKLKDWVSDGGTLIAIGSSAAALADSSIAISKVKLRRQSISKLDDYEKAFMQESGIKNITIDSLEIWEGKTKEAPKSTEEKETKFDTTNLAELDKQAIKYYPQGAILQVDLNGEHWLNYGMGGRVPALLAGSYAFLSKSPVQTAGRFSSQENLRLSGLLWPEAKKRIANSAYCTRESMGQGQIILFAEEPNYRSYFYGTARMLINAVLLGPGHGASQPVEW